VLQYFFEKDCFPFSGIVRSAGDVKPTQLVLVAQRRLCNTPKLGKEEDKSGIAPGFRI